MNERLKELAEQAGFVYLNTDRSGFGVCHQFVLNKFAELLIKECSKVASDFVTDYNSKLLDDYTISAWHLLVHIEDHFGIEE